MTTSIDILGIRRRLDPHVWAVAREFGPDGWALDLRPEIASRAGSNARIIITSAPNPDDDFTESDLMWIHASMSRSDQVPTYADIKRLHQAVWPDGWAYQVFAPETEHVNIHEFALHLWGRPDGRKELPNFGISGSI